MYYKQYEELRISLRPEINNYFLATSLGNRKTTYVYLFNYLILESFSYES